MQVRGLGCAINSDSVITFFTDQRNMGMSMKVEKSSLDQVRKRFEFNKKKKEEDKKTYGESNCMLAGRGTVGIGVYIQSWSDMRVYS